MRKGWIVGGVAALGVFGAAWIGLGARARTTADPLSGRGAFDAPPEQAVAVLDVGAQTSATQANPAATREAAPSAASPTPAPTPVAPARHVFELTGAPPLESPGTSIGFVSEMRAVRVDSDLGSLRVGDRVTLDLPSGTSVVATVGRVHASAEGDRSWSGHLEGHGRRHPVTFTQGDIATFATISTPEGLFGLEAIQGEGVVFRDERERMHDPRLSCAVLPD